MEVRWAAAGSRGRGRRDGPYEYALSNPNHRRRFGGWNPNHGRVSAVWENPEKMINPNPTPVGGSGTWDFRFLWLGVFAAAPTRQMCHATLTLIFLGCRPPALPHIRKSRDLKHLRFWVCLARWGWWQLVELDFRGQLVAYSPVGGLSSPVGGLFGLRILARKFFGDTSADFLYGKNFMALYVKWLFPYKKVLAHG